MDLARAVQDITGQKVTLAYVDQGYTDETARQGANTHGIELEVNNRLQAPTKTPPKRGLCEG